MGRWTLLHNNLLDKVTIKSALCAMHSFCYLGWQSLDTCEGDFKTPFPQLLCCRRGLRLVKRFQEVLFKRTVTHSGALVVIIAGRRVFVLFSDDRARLVAVGRASSERIVLAHLRGTDSAGASRHVWLVVSALPPEMVVEVDVEMTAHESVGLVLAKAVDVSFHDARLRHEIAGVVQVATV